MCGFGFLQAQIVGGIAFSATGPPGNWVPQFANLMLLICAGTALGLCISSLSNSEEMAVALVPVAIIPQIVLAGVVSTLPDFPELIARSGITVYWGVKAAMNLPNYHRLTASFEPSLSVSFSVIAIHALVYLLGAWVGIRKSQRD